jgi:hypothetical protein
MSEQHPNPKNKVPGKHCGSRTTHNENRTKHSNASRQASAGERKINDLFDPPNRAGRVAFNESTRAKAAKEES